MAAGNLILSSGGAFFTSNYGKVAAGVYREGRLQVLPLEGHLAVVEFRERIPRAELMRLT